MNNRETDNLKIQSYCGKTLRENVEPPETIVESILWKEDAVMLLGSEKSGKSINAQQLLCCIVSGEPFLGIFKVKKVGPVVYIQAEGKRNEFVSRLNNMCLSIENFNDDMFLHIFKKYCPLNIPLVMEAIFEKIDAQVKIWKCNPICICVDSVYKAMEGDLNENKDIIAFTNAIDSLISRYSCSVILIHHDSKEWRDEKNKSTIERGDKGSYGSVFLRAYVDHILYLKMNRDKSRSFTCDTTRSGKTSADKLDLILIEPSPLLFQIKGDYTASCEMFKHQLKMHNRLSYSQLVTNTGLSEPTLKQASSILIKNKLISFENNGQNTRLFYLL